MIQKEKATQRNITPNFVILKSTSRPKVGKNGQKLSHKQKSQEPNQHTRSDRSSSRNSKCSFDTYERRVLHLSKLKNSLLAKQDTKTINSNITYDTSQPNSNTRRNSSNTKESTNGRENHLYHNRKNRQDEKSLSRKKSSGSGKIMIRPYSRSNSRRDQQSLEKQEQRAKAMNVDLLQNLMKQQSQTPNYIKKLRLNKNERENRDKKKQKQKVSTKSALLKLDISIKGPQAIQEYQIYGELGKGAYGLVRMGINKRTGQKVAIKFYHKKHLDEMNRRKNLERQINILAGLDHPVIARLIEAIETPTQIFLVLEYGGANSLYNYLLSKHEHRLKQYEAKKFLLVIAQTLKHMHERNIVHRDIKAENILINRYKQIKLIDFGFSIHSVPPDTIDTFCGTPTYMAPEIVSKIDHVPVYTDMWSLGILFYVLLQGNYPFRSKSEDELFQKIRRGKFQYIHHDTSKESMDIIESLLRVNPYHRLTINDLLSDKYANFFQGAKLEQEEL